MSRVKKVSALLIDCNVSSINQLTKVMERLKIKHTSVSSIEEAKGNIKKGFLGKLNYNTFIININISEEKTIEMASYLNNLYGRKVTIIIVIQEENTILSQKLYKAGASMVIPVFVFQSYLYNWYLKVTNKDVTKNDVKKNMYDFSGHKVMLVEDNDFNMEVGIEFLTQVGLHVIKAKNGQIALDKFEESDKGEIKLILMDIQMPIMNGYEATKKIRNSSHPDAKKIPIIAMTANSLPEDIEKEKECGMNNHITKPISIKALYEIISEIIYKES